MTWSEVVPEELKAPVVPRACPKQRSSPVEPFEYLGELHVRVVRARQLIDAERRRDASEVAAHSSTVPMKPVQSWAIACENSTRFAARPEADENAMRNSLGVSRMAAAGLRSGGVADPDAGQSGHQLPGACRRRRVARRLGGRGGSSPWWQRTSRIS